MKTYQGGCHCGKVRYEADIELESAMECNCSHCSKKGFLLSFIPEGQFRLLTGEGETTEYRFNKEAIAHLFCKTCGVQSFGRGAGEHGPMIAINVRCLDDVEPSTLTITPFDGKSF